MQFFQLKLATDLLLVINKFNSLFQFVISNMIIPVLNYLSEVVFPSNPFSKQYFQNFFHPNFSLKFLKLELNSLFIYYFY